MASKKTFTQLKQPKLADKKIQSFENMGCGHDSASNIATHTNKEKTKRLSIDIPVSTHLKFKTLCSATGRTMIEEVQSLIEQRIFELNKENKIF